MMERQGKRSTEGENLRPSKSKVSRKKHAKAAADLEEERRLTSLLFGSGGGPNVIAAPLPQASLEEEDVPLFEIDRAGESAESELIDIEQQDGTDEHNIVDDNDKVAWVDDDDQQLQVNILQTSRLKKLRKTRTEEAASALSGTDLESRLRCRFQSTTEATARTDWARLDQETTEEENAIQSASVSLFSGSTRHSKLPSNIINLVRCPDANQSDPNQSVVQSVHFHPGSDAENPLLLTAGLDKTLRFFQVGTEKSAKVHGIHFPKLPIYSASFLGSSGNVVVSGRRPFFYIYDAASGKLDLIPRISGREEKSLERFTASPDGQTVAFIGNDGYIVLFDAQRKHWIADLKMNGSVRALEFTENGDQILGSGSDGDVYRFDLRTRRCIERFPNEDGTITSYLAASSRHLAVGAESGVVNIYSDLDASTVRKRTPIKSILNLRTSADMLRFNPDGQILAMSTRREKNGLKLLHVPSATVFSNWPTSKTPLNYVWSLDFSPESRFLAVGNDKGSCLLYRLMHYHVE